jgi:hypothetical protein
LQVGIRELEELEDTASMEKLKTPATRMKERQMETTSCWPAPWTTDVTIKDFLVSYTAIQEV